MRKNQYKTIFFILLILIISISLIYLIQPTPNNCNYSTNKNKIVDITEKNKVDNNLENLLTSDNPGNFFLTIDKNVVYEGGNITFFWTASEGADNYSVYMFDRLITEINSSLTLRANQTAISPFPISGLVNGEYYFTILAYNEHAATMSDNEYIIVYLSDSNGDKTVIVIPGYSFILILSIGFIVSLLLVKNILRKKN